jgi:hypothetical protein
MAGRDTGDPGAGSVGIGCDGDGVDEAEVDDIERDIGVVAVAESGEDGGFGEDGGWSWRGHWFDDTRSTFWRHS